jgi:hypothetical protein
MRHSNNEEACQQDANVNIDVSFILLSNVKYFSNPDGVFRFKRFGEALKVGIVGVCYREASLVVFGF